MEVEIKNLSLITIFALYWTASLFAQGDTLWTKTFDGLQTSEGNSVQQTQDGGYIIVGVTDFIPGLEQGHVWLIKTSEQGDEEWAREFTLFDRSKGNSVKQTVDGGYIIVGDAFPDFQVDVWLIKVDANGSEEWNKTFGGSGLEWGKSVLQTADGGYIITGQSSGVWLIKTDANGNEVWNKTFGDASNAARGTSVIETTDGGFVIAGREGTAALLIKTNGNGNEVWNKKFGGIESIFSSVKETADGGYIMGGSENFKPRLLKTDLNGIEEWRIVFTEINFSFKESAQQTLDGGYILAGADAGLLLVKIDALGNEVWKKIYGEDNGGRGHSVQQTSDGDYIVTGAFNDDVWLLRISSSIIGVENESRELPQEFTLDHNYPNPFNPVTNMEYSLPNSGDVTLIVYNLIGKEVGRLVDEQKPAGSYTVKWDASNFASGIYFYRLQVRQTDVGQAPDFVQTRKMVLLK